MANFIINNSNKSNNTSPMRVLPNPGSKLGDTCYTSMGWYKQNVGVQMGSADQVYDIEKQSDGKIIISGRITSYGAVPYQVTKNLLRLFPDGSPDKGFNPTNVPTHLKGAGTVVTAITIQDDDKIVFGGAYTGAGSYNGVTIPSICRLNADGSLDNTFNYNGTTTTGVGVVDLAIQKANKKILVVGEFHSSVFIAGSARRHFWRLNTDGTLDTSFASGGDLTSNVGPNGYAYKVKEQSDGKIILSGNFTTYNGTNVGNICRINQDGTLDTSFNRLGILNGSGANSVIIDMVIQPDNKIIIVGHFSTFNGISVGHICRLNPDGTLDDTFDTSGGDPRVTYVAIAPDGKIYTSCGFVSWDSELIGHPSSIIRLNADGTRDHTFVNPGCANVILPEKDGRVIVGGGWGQIIAGESNICRGIYRYNNDGSGFSEDGTSLWNYKATDSDFTPVSCEGYKQTRFIRNTLAATAIREGQYNSYTGKFNPGFPTGLGDHWLPIQRLNSRPIFNVGKKVERYFGLNTIYNRKLAPTPQ